MESGGIGEEEVYGFIADEIETVPHLEALLLLWSSLDNAPAVAPVQ